MEKFYKFSFLLKFYVLWSKTKFITQKNVINKKVAHVNIWTFKTKIFKIYWYLGLFWQILCYKIFLLLFQRNESEVEGMSVAGASSNFVGDLNDSSIASASPSTATNPDDDGHKEGGKKKKNRCLSCKKKVGLTGKNSNF